MKFTRRYEDTAFQGSINQTLVNIRYPIQQYIRSVLHKINFECAMHRPTVATSLGPSSSSQKIPTLSSLTGQSVLDSTLVHPVR